MKKFMMMLFSIVVNIAILLLYVYGIPAPEGGLYNVAVFTVYFFTVIGVITMFWPELNQARIKKYKTFYPSWYKIVVLVILVATDFVLIYNGWFVLGTINIILSANAYSVMFGEK